MVDACLQHSVLRIDLCLVIDAASEVVVKWVVVTDFHTFPLTHPLQLLACHLHNHLPFVVDTFGYRMMALSELLVHPFLDHPVEQRQVSG